MISPEEVKQIVTEFSNNAPERCFLRIERNTAELHLLKKIQEISYISEIIQKEPRFLPVLTISIQLGIMMSETSYSIYQPMNYKQMIDNFLLKFSIRTDSIEKTFGDNRIFIYAFSLYAYVYASECIHRKTPFCIPTDFRSFSSILVSMIRTFEGPIHDPIMHEILVLASLFYLYQGSFHLVKYFDVAVTVPCTYRELRIRSSHVPHRLLSIIPFYYVPPL